MKREIGISLCDTCANCECIFQAGIVRKQCEFYIDEVEEIDFIAEHQKADMSKVDRITINKKVYLSADKVLEIIKKKEKGFGQICSGDKVREIFNSGWVSCAQEIGKAVDALWGEQE